MAVHYLPAKEVARGDDYDYPECWVIASHWMWLPGIYATEAAAKWAFKFPDAVLQELNDRICDHRLENRPITTEDLRAARAKMVAGEGE